jgi:hypothetical protein
MRPRTFYSIAILLPALALAAVVPFTGPPMQVGPPLGPGATEVWLFPRSAVRELLSYCLVAAWLFWQLRSRSPEAFTRVLWFAPLAILAVNAVMLTPFVLVHGRARDLFADDSSRIVSRMVVRLVIGSIYVGLTEFVRTRLLGIELANESEQ